MFKRIKRSVDAETVSSGSSSSSTLVSSSSSSRVLRKHSSTCSLEELNRFERLEKIGEGTYGVVYKAKDTENSNRLVALKRIRLES
ncbi:unnamed protein product [Allacma fusca]|uniref:Protein kinase domain-containing protein n=1 Tax=Allacma fusca TaxID=39272 RepID=A0A8J2K045_9HEXA|nr:unnamed protein product [Allacma fusca]